MGKKLDALLGRSFKTSKFKALVNLALARLAVLKNQKQTRFSLARSDVVQLLNLGHQDRALLRVEQVIKEQNMLDAFAMIEGYCLLLTERVKLIEHDNRECPEELKEAISSLIFAASRCGEFPELQQIRALFTSRYGKEFTSRAVELRNNCGVNPKMIQKMSTRLPSLEARMKVLKEIANENGIALKLVEEEAPTIASEVQSLLEKLIGGMGNQPVQNRSFSSNQHEGVDRVEGLTSSVNRRKQYTDVADAAQEAFISAAYAAAAARAAVELSKSSPRAPDDQNNQRKQVFNSNKDMKSGLEKGEYLGETEDNFLGHDKGKPLDTYSLDTEDEEPNEEAGSPEIKRTKQVSPRKISSITSSRISGKAEKLPQEVIFDESDNEAKSEKLNLIGDENPWGERRSTLPYFSEKQLHSSFHDGSRTYYDSRSSGGLTVKSPPRLNLEKPISVRTRR
ncbi:hypothetical protein Cgig2_010710 [Carnegiea gigantea]|uniref:IST1-like protein n=1 Tax=Carnegiea gigantea TaxID=171969 RepID=A0A9Q1KMI9_9CARY|nr:hypothetical protein Cgig2_010710 [Carnegiea gigantea]